MPRIQPCQEHFLVLLLGGAPRIPLTGGRSTRKKVKVKVSQSCPTLCDPMGYTVHGILQTRILEWVDFSFSRRSSQPRDQTTSPTLQADSWPAEPQGKPKNTGMGSLSLLQWIFPTQESNHGLHHRRILYQLSYEGSHLYTQSQVVIYGHAFSTIDESSFS